MSKSATEGLIEEAREILAEEGLGVSLAELTACVDWFAARMDEVGNPRSNGWIVDSWLCESPCWDAMKRRVLRAREEESLTDTQTLSRGIDNS